MKVSGNKAVAEESVRPSWLFFSRGFTLIELLVVIAIIGVLAAILMPALNSALTKAEKARAQTELTQIVAAIKAYYGDYGRMPVAVADDGAPDKTYGAKNKPNKQKVIMDNLRAKDNVGNPKGTVFLDVPKDSMIGTDKDGGSYVEADGYYLDPWGNPYVLSVDANFDGSAFLSGLDSPPAPSASMTVTSFLAVAISYGPDPGSTKSFLTSWGKN
ncbi:MAG: type II secretion system GspH family protein [Candidatus Hydrogenedentes bacterium]|nr:type II secretion system GspH family protein [Candidatus Hydrogenedentota bacterium]